MSLNNITSWSTIVFETRYTEKTISGVHVSPDSAETLVSRGGITNNRSIIYFLSNISAKLPKSVDVNWSYSVQYQCRF